MSKKDEILVNKAVAVNATMGGFYHIKGLASKSGVCRHVSCGSTAFRPCRWIGTTWMQPQHTAPKCGEEWCKNFGARPASLGQKVKCTRLHLKPYTKQELAVPTVKPDGIAITMKVAFNDRVECEYGIALYDLLEDKWFNDGWWSEYTNYSMKYNDKGAEESDYEILMPHRSASDATTFWIPPKEISNIDQVLVALKAQL